MHIVGLYCLQIRFAFTLTFVLSSIFLNIISPSNDMKAKIDTLLADYPSIDIMPNGWENEPLWQ